MRGRRGMTMDTAPRLACVARLPVFWMDLQVAYDASRAKAKNGRVAGDLKTIAV